MNTRGPWRPLIALIIAALSGIIIALIASAGGGHHPPAAVTIATPQGKVVAPAKTVRQVQSSDAGRHVRLGPGVETPGTARQDNRAASPAAPRIVGPPPLASPQQAGCLTRQLPTNYSYRTGVRPSLIVLHLTVSPNVVGWGDVNAIFAFFSRSATQASSNYVIDAEGHCIYMVPETAKAWAQANFNSATACSIEVVNYGLSGHESTYVGGQDGPGERQLARIVHDCALRWHIPLREGRVGGCSVLRSGVIDHDHLGACGGGHNDINPYAAGCARGQVGNTWQCVDRVIAAASAGGVVPVSAHVQGLCREYAHYRREVAAGRFPAARRARARAVRNALAHGHYRCSAQGVASR